MDTRNEHTIQSFRKRFGKHLLILLLIPWAFAIGANLLVHGGSTPLMYDDVKNVPPRHTAIVLGARVYDDGSPSAVLRDRLKVALTLYRTKKVRKILVTGDHGSKHYNEVGGMFNWLRSRGVPETDIFLDHAGFRTLDSMKRAAQVFEVESAIICTQQFHLARSVFLANQSGIDAVGVATDLRRYRHHFLNHTREFAARAVSVLETFVFNRGPKMLGPPIPIHGDGRLTHDEAITEG